MAINIGFLGTPDIGIPTLEYLNSSSDFNLKVVISQPDRPKGRKLKLTPSPIKQKAIELGIPVFTPEKFSDPQFIDTLKKFELDSLIIIAYGQLIKQNVLDLYHNKILNIHGSLLPKYRGAAPIQRAIMNGDSSTGLSLQVIVKKMDAGAIVGSLPIDIFPQETSLDLYKKMMKGAPTLVERYLKKYLIGEISPVPQNDTEVTFAHKIKKEEGLIDWSQSAQFIINQYRGMQMGPGVWFMFQNKKYKIYDLTWAPYTFSDAKQNYGKVLNLNPLTIACKKSALVIPTIQPESRKKMDTEEFLKGFNLMIGDILES